MHRPLSLFIAGILGLGLSAIPALAGTATAGTPAHTDETIPDIGYQRFVLDNGLTVIVHEDHKAPVVAVSVWYHVGSADEPAGKTGFAHLFEHLMFSGSENHPGTYFQPFQQVGATGINGTTSFDRTNYYETVPTTALDMALWMESDRMGHLLGAIGQAELDTQRGVVQNEKRQGENRPYGRVGQRLLSSLYPANHPYQHDTIGSMQDLDAASLEDVKRWFTDYYGAANTTLVLAGDITPAQARDKALKYFGDIPAGKPVPRQQPWVTPLRTRTRDVQHDHVAQARIYRSWLAPQLGSDDAILLDLATTVLGGSKTSRLYQRLVYQQQLVDDVSASITPLALASQLLITADIRQGVDPAQVEAVIEEELQKFLTDGPTADELLRARTQQRAGFIRGLERVSAKAELLAEGQLYRGTPDAYRSDLQRAATATADSVRHAAATWFGHGDNVLTVLPVPARFDLEKEQRTATPRAAADGKPSPRAPAATRHRTVASTIDRSTGVPVTSRFPDLRFPALQRGRLSNGIEVILAERHNLPVTQIQLLFDAGFAADQDLPAGTASFATAMLSESTHTLDSVELARRRQRLGASMASRCDLDSCSAALSALNDQLQPSLALFADAVRNPAFKPADIERVRGQLLAAIAQEKTQPVGLALRILPPLLYGDTHPYGIAFTGSGDEASIGSLRSSQLQAFHRNWLRADNVRILVAGDTTLDKILPQLDAAFGDWSPGSARPAHKDIRPVAAQSQPRVYLIDRPDAPQSLILAGLLAPPTKDDNNLALTLANGAFGGSFTSRLNMNLRESKRWAYGAQSMLIDAQGQRPFLFYAPVQTDKTADSVSEILHEASAVIGAKPLSAEEIDNIRNQRIRALPGSYESTATVLSSVKDILQYQRADDDVQTLKSRLEKIDQSAAQHAIAQVIVPAAMTWVIVGDRKQIEAPLRALQLGKLQVLDADGKPLSN
jgi:zinc protease